MNIRKSINKKVELYKKIRGCLLGGAVGDALGAPVEFMNRREIQEEFGNDRVTGYVEYPDGTGSITDDTQMTLFTSEGIMRAVTRANQKGICSVEDVVYYAYQRWLLTQGLKNIAKPVREEYLHSGWLIKCKELFIQRAPGNSCLSALQAREQGNISQPVNNSKGCGTVMRMAPAGLVGGDAFKLGRELSALTHGHPTGYYAGAAMADLIQHIYEDEAHKPLQEYVKKTVERLELEEKAQEVVITLKQALEMASTHCSLDEAEKLGEAWIAEEALAVSVFCALRSQDDFRKGVLAAVNIDGDSDSTGAITGNILGVYLGENEIPQDWISNLRERIIVKKIADDLHNIHEPATEQWQNKYPGF